MALPCDYDALARFPVREDDPTGRPVLTDARWDRLQEAMQSSGTSASDGSGVSARDWPFILATGAELLTQVGKDARVMSYVGQALFQMRGYAGLSEAFACWADLLGPLWDKAHPEQPRRRQAALQGFVRIVCDGVKATPPEGLPPDLMVGLLSRLDTLTSAMELRLGAEAPSLRDVREIVQFTVDSQQPATRIPEPSPSPFPRNPPPPLPTPAGGAVADAHDPSAALTVAAQPLPSDASAANVAEAFNRSRAQVFALTELAQQRDPANPVPYRLARDWAWLTVALPKTEGANPTRTRIEFPHRQSALKLQKLREDHLWTELLSSAEAIWRRAVLWMDPHLLVAQSLRELGHAVAAEAVVSCAQELVSRLPGLLDLHFVDMTPLASPEARAWLTARDATRAEDRSGELPSVVPRVDTPVSGLEQADGALEQSRQRLARGDIPGASSLVEAQLRGLSRPRDVFLFKLRVAQALLDAGRSRAALALLQTLDEDARTLRLDHWEPELAAEVLVTLHRARLAPSSAPAPSAEIADLIGRSARLGSLSLLMSL